MQERDGQIATRIAAGRKTVASHQQAIAEKENQLAEANKQLGVLTLDMANLSNQGQLLTTILAKKDEQLTADSYRGGCREQEVR